MTRTAGQRKRNEYAPRIDQLRTHDSGAPCEANSERVLDDLIRLAVDDLIRTVRRGVLTSSPFETTARTIRRRMTTEAEKKHAEVLAALAASPNATVKPVEATAWFLRPGEAAALREALRPSR